MLRFLSMNTILMRFLGLQSPGFTRSIYTNILHFSLAFVLFLFIIKCKIEYVWYMHVCIIQMCMCVSSKYRWDVVVLLSVPDVQNKDPRKHSKNNFDFFYIFWWFVTHVLHFRDPLPLVGRDSLCVKSVLEYCVFSL